MTTKVKNDFRSELDKLKAFVRDNKELEAVIRAAEISDSVNLSDSRNKSYRLPYSSDPQPIGDRWRY